jgi:hypothetical protein
MTNENIAQWEDLVHAVVNCIVCELAIALELLVVTFCKNSMNPTDDTNPVYSHPIYVTISRNRAHLTDEYL